MTARSQAAAALRIIRQFAFGPWPLHALAMWTFLSTVILGVLFRLFGPQGMIPATGQLANGFASVVVVGLLGPGAVLVPLMIYMRIRHRFMRHAMRSPEYLLTLLVASAFGGAILNSVLRFQPIFIEVLNHPRLINSTLRIFFPVWFISAVLGSVFSRIQRESDTSKQALQTVVAQRRMLLESEERVRGQVAAFLHDRVQTDLVSIALRIRATIGQDPDATSIELTSVVSELERVRSQEVRRASRQLSPNLATVSLDAALRDVAESYRPGMNVTIIVNESVAHRIAQCHDDTQATGIYRICEQGLLNSAIHGHATDCMISVSLTRRDDIVLNLSDNGVGQQHETLQPGMGMTVISAWVEALGGVWSLEPAEQGMTLTASFPCA